MKRKKKLALSARRNLTGVLFVLPWMIGFAVFFAYPLVQSIIFSMNKVVFTAKGRNLNFVGLTITATYLPRMPTSWNGC